MDEIRLLIIDDNPDDIELVSRALRGVEICAFDIHVASSGEKALDITRAQTFDCVLLDYNLPGMSGIELFDQITPNVGSAPVIILTGQADEMLAAALIKAGAQDYINKFSVTSVSLYTKINDAISHATAGHDREVPAPHRIVIIDDNEDDIELCNRLLKNTSTPYTLDMALSGQKGLALLAEGTPDCVLLDYSLPGESGLDILKTLTEHYPYVPVILMTGQGNETVAVEAIKLGAENYIVKGSLDSELLDKTIRVAVQKKQLEKRLAEKESELDEKRTELDEAYTFLNLVQDTIPGYVFVKDASFRIVKANRRFIELYPPAKRDKVIGYTTFEEYDEDEKNAFLAMDRKAFEEGVSETLERITFPNGEIRTLFTVKTRFEGAKGEAFILGTATDVTERELLIAQLEKSNADLEQFAYVASHDLKSPLNAIRKLVTWIEEDYGAEMPAGAKPHFEMIKSRSDRLSQLLTDLLEYSRVNKKLGENEPVQFGTLVKLAHAMNEHADKFSLTVTDTLLELPKTAMQIVFMNLLSNTIKHHHKACGEISISVKAVPGGYQFDYLDDGPGIDKEYAEKVFQMFLTLKARDSVEGSGMGLAMVKKVLDYYSGRVRLVYDDDVTDGVHFEIFWPSQVNAIPTSVKESAQ